MYRFAIDNEEELNDGIVRVAIEQLTFIKEQAKIPRSMDLSVHEMRKAFKRLRALLRLIRFDIGKQLFLTENTRYKNMAGALSTLRDIHVIISYLAGCFEADELVIEEESFIRFINHLNKQKETEMIALIENKTLDLIIKECDDQVYRIKEYPLTQVGPHTIYKGVTHAYKKCLNKMEAAQLMLDDGMLHKLRKKVKYLYNQMLLIQAVWPDYFTHYSDALKNISELLGDDHNLAETIVIIQETPDHILKAEEKQSLIRSINNERSTINDEVWPLLGKAFTESSAAFAKRVKSYWLISRE